MALLSSTRGRAAVIAVTISWVGLFGLLAIPAQPANSDQSAAISVTPRAVIIDGTPVRAFVGSYSGSRAVLQFEADPRYAKPLFIDLQRGQLETETSQIAPEVTTNEAGSTLTLVFDRGSPIGPADYTVVVRGVSYSFDCNWLNA